MLYNVVYIILYPGLRQPETMIILCHFYLETTLFFVLSGSASSRQKATVNWDQLGHSKPLFWVWCFNCLSQTFCLANKTNLIGSPTMDLTRPFIYRKQFQKQNGGVSSLGSLHREKELGKSGCGEIVDFEHDTWKKGAGMAGIASWFGPVKLLLDTRKKCEKLIENAHG